MNAISGWSIEKYYLITKNRNRGSSTIHLHCVDMIDIQNHHQKGINMRLVSVETLKYWFT